MIAPKILVPIRGCDAGVHGLVSWRDGIRADPWGPRVAVVGGGQDTEGRESLQPGHALLRAMVPRTHGRRDTHDQGATSARRGPPHQIARRGPPALAGGGIRA